MDKRFIGLVLLLTVIVLVSGLNVSCSRSPLEKETSISYPQGTVAGAGERIETVRRREKFNTGWRFIKKDVKNAQAFDLNDSTWRKLNLPHDWAIEGPFTKEVSFQGGYLPYPGVGWYRKVFMIPSDAKCVRVEFDGVMRDAKVCLNGKYIGSWPYGYSSFSFDLTEHVRRGEKNVIAVRVENEDESSRWYPGSGIYRNVWLTLTNPVHVKHWGTFVTAKKITDKSAFVNVRTQIQNQSQKGQDVVLETIIYDAKGKNIAEGTASHRVGKKASKEFEQELRVFNPVRWDIDNPYLYKAVSNVKVDGEIVDRYETKFGIRTLRFDAEEGFFLNGRSVKIKGVNLHHGLGPLGIAFSRRAAERQLEIMKEMGCNAIRTAHNPPAGEQLELCDEMGLLVMDETFDEWKKPKVPNGYNKLFDEWAEKDTRALLRRDRNHPSIFLWSTGNEIPELHTGQGKKNAKMFAEICREMDPTRPVSSGIHLTVKLDEELADSFDVLGLNYWQDRYEKIHKEFGNKPLLSTESSAVISTRGEYHFPVKRIPAGYRDKSLQISSYDIANCGFGDLPDVEFNLQEEYRWLMGEFVWSGFDYHGEPDPYEDMWPAHSSYFGIVDMCGFKKDRFYLYQSQWTDEPMIHLLPHWNWEGRQGEVTPVYCYTNCAWAQLFVNGKSLGKKEKKAGQYRLKWNEVVYQPGSIKAVGYDDEGKVLCEKEIRTAGKPYKIELVADRETITADGEDLCFVTVKIVDKQGNLCPLADNLVRFKIEGNGRVACVGNGNPISHESYQAKQRKAFHGLCLAVVRSTKQEGAIRLTANSEGLQAEQILLKTKGHLTLSESAVYATDAPAMQWHKGHGTDNGDHVHYGLQTSDGGYIMTGQTSEGRRGSSNMLVVKTDAAGDLQWQKIIGTPKLPDYANFVTEVSDGFIVAGALYVSGDQQQQRALAKFNSDGDIAWQKTYPSDGNGSIRGIGITGDGGIVATGYVGSEERGYKFISEDGRAFIMKTDADGNLAWEKTLAATPHGMRVEEVAGGYAIGANVWVNEGEKSHQNVCLILTDSRGNEKFSETYGGDGDDQVFDFAVTTDGGYIFGGHSRSPSYGTVNWDYLLLKVGPDKKEQWHKTFGQPRGYDAKYIHDESYGVKQTRDGGYIVAGGSGDEHRYSESGHPGGRSDLWRAYVVKTDADGNLMWQGLYGELQGNNAAEYINLTSDGGYVVFTDSDTAGSMGSNNYGLMKIAPDTPGDFKTPQTQAPAMQWHKGHGTDNGDHVHYGLQTGDGGYIMAGQTSEGRRGSSDMLVVKTDAKGDLQWQKIIGTPKLPDYATFVTEVSDGFIVAGALAVSGDQDRALVKLDTSGNIVWQKTYHDTANGEIRGVDETGDGGLIATGYVGSGRSGYLFISDDGQGSILKTDADGNLAWEKTLSAATHGMRVYEVAAGFAVSGVSREGNRNFCLIKTDDSGNIQWHKNYGGNKQEDLFDSDLSKDGGYILAGHKLIYGKVSDNTDVFDFWLVKVDSTGNLQWDKTFGQPRGYDANHIRDECYGVKATCDGGYIMIGGSGDEDSYSGRGHPAGSSDIWKSYVVRTDGNGNLLWEGLYGDPAGNNAGEYINLTSGGGYIIFTDSDTAGNMRPNNFGLMKIAPDHAPD